MTRLRGFFVVVVAVIVLCCLVVFTHQQQEQHFEIDTEQQQQQQKQEAKMSFWSSPTYASNHQLVQHLGRERRVFTDAVKAIFEKVDRKWFVPQRLHTHAYEDRPLPIGWDQTVSAPHMHAIMFELLIKNLDKKPNAKVLDVGYGSGIMLAMFAEAVAEGNGSVFGIEYVPPVAALGIQNLQAVPRYAALMAEGKIVAKQGDGWHGWAEHAPFDAIHVGAAAAEIPDELVQQLAPGGRMLCPVGPDGGAQELLVIDKLDNGKVTVKSDGGVMFVPLVKSRP